jgi:chemotaxis protein MotA
VTIILGLVFMVASILGSYAMMGGHLPVLWQPFELVIILGSGIGAFVVANPMKVIKDTFKATFEAFRGATPTDREYLDVLGLLYSLMREFRARARNEVEVHFENPKDSPIFQKYKSVVNNKE